LEITDSYIFFRPTLRPRKKFVLVGTSKNIGILHTTHIYINFPLPQMMQSIEEAELRISENKKAEQLLQYLFYYFGGDYLEIPTRNDIVAENDEQKKSYLRIFTLGSGDRKKALQAIQDNNFETALDDMFSFHRKIARENGIAISVEDLKMISDRFPISALMRD
ncbi:14399_t:CDS:2, partial [Dentiscutata heterogama]